MGETSVDLRSADGLTVADVMVRRPKSVPREATVAEVRRKFEKPGLRTLLVVDGDAFCGTIERTDLPDSVPDEAPALDYARADAERVPPDLPVAEAMPLLEQDPEGRLVVVDPDGVTLRGLLCLKRDGERFCLDG
jgi:CBS domain-containing protein